MASDFVRNIKGVRNIDTLPPDITTENDLISTSDGEVYVVTNKGYEKITGGELSANIDTLKSDVKILKLDMNDHKISIDNQKTQIETTTSKIETLDTKTLNNTSEIKTLKKLTDNNKSEIETLKTLKKLTDNNKSEIETLKTLTDNNKSEIKTLKKTTDNNISEIALLESKIEDVEININSLNENIKKLNEYNKVKVYEGIDLTDKNSLNTLPLGVNYVTKAKNKTEEMRTNNGWLTVNYANNVKRYLFQPFSEGRTYYNYILNNDNLGEWK